MLGLGKSNLLTHSPFIPMGNSEKNKIASTTPKPDVDAEFFELKGIVRIDDLVQVSVYTIESGQSFWLSNTDSKSRPIRLISVSEESRTAVINAFGHLHTLELSDKFTPINMVYKTDEASEYAKAIEVAAEYLKKNPKDTILNAPISSSIRTSLTASYNSLSAQQTGSQSSRAFPGDDRGKFYNDFSRAALIRRAYLINLGLLKASNPEKVDSFNEQHKKNN